MTIDLKNSDIFFAKVRDTIFHGNMSQSQVDGINAIFDAFEMHEFVEDQEERAYILATVYWESAHTMQPIEEYGKGKGRAYGVAVNGHIYYGRGYVQLTWEANYKKMGDLLGVDLVNHPELALDPKIAGAILVIGMERGLFSPAKGPLSKYLRTAEAWVHARATVNGTDHENDIAQIAKLFDAAMEAVEGKTHVHVLGDTTPIDHVPTPVPQPAETCEIDGDSIAEGVNGFLKGCKGNHKVGDSSSQIIAANRVAGDATYVVISAGTNDFGQYNPNDDANGVKKAAITAKLNANLETLRAKAVAKGGKPIWIKPSGTRQDVAFAGPVVQAFADKYGDDIVGYDKTAGDRVHPADYTVLGKAVLAKMKKKVMPPVQGTTPQPTPISVPKPTTAPIDVVTHPGTGAVGGVIAGGLAAHQAGFPIGWVITAAIAVGVVGALILAWTQYKKQTASKGK